MGKGRLISIQVAERAAGPMRALTAVRAIGGLGLEGDRYFARTGTYSKKAGPDREVTLIELEAVEALRRDYGVELDPKDSRRNLVTQGVALNHLVGREFTIGEVKFRGIRLCEPCSHLATLAAREVVPGLVHRGGLRAAILTDGVIRVGDVLSALVSQD
jgi:MOSC domain-containing protein YiiM